MTGHETVKYEKKTQHLDSEGGA